jgi:hypothetical protein
MGLWEETSTALIPNCGGDRRSDARAKKQGRNFLMNLKNICLGALALSMVGGVAFAGALDEPTNMAPFFTDASMKTMKPKAEFKAAWDAMAKDKQTAMMKECQDAAMSKPHAEFCANLQALGGAN